MHYFAGVVYRKDLIAGLLRLCESSVTKDCLSEHDLVRKPVHLAQTRKDLAASVLWIDRVGRRSSLGESQNFVMSRGDFKCEVTRSREEKRPA